MSAFERSATGVLITDSCHETVRNVAADTLKSQNKILPRLGLKI